MERALKRLWSHPTLSGCYLVNDVEPNEQKKLSINDIKLSRRSIYGIAKLPNGKQVACATHPVIYDFECSFFNFSIPFGSLCEKYKIGKYPFHDDLPLDWQKPIDDWLYDLSEYTFKKVKFHFGAIGFIDCENLDEIADSDIPEKRYYALLKKNNRRLKVYHPTIYSYPFEI